MNTLAEKRQCSGCGACAAICPHNAISMLPDSEGFLYPETDAEKCISCGLCTKACPVLFPGEPKIPEKVYALRNADASVLEQSSSGGMFTELADVVLSEGGVVFGAAFEEGFRRVTHVCASSRDELAPIRKSKYLQSDQKNAYRKVREYLRAGKKVLYTGTPCQIAGLRRFLMKDYGNLYTAELICHGVPSPKVWDRYLSEVARGRKVMSVSFRDNRYSWKNCHFSIGFGGSEYFCRFRESAYIKGFLSDMFTRPSCCDCMSKSYRSGADLTIGDYWGVWKFMPGLSDGKGVSVAVVNTGRGAHLLEKSASDKHPVDYAGVLKYNASLEKSAVVHPRRNDFFRQLDGRTVHSLVSEYCPDRFRLKADWKMRSLMYRLYGMFSGSRRRDCRNSEWKERTGHGK